MRILPPTQRHHAHNHSPYPRWKNCDQEKFRFPLLYAPKNRKNPESLINDFAEKEAITLHHTQQMMYEDHHYLLGYVKSLHTPLNLDLIREDTHIKTLPLPIQTAYYTKIQDDKKHYHFRFSETKPADLPTIQTFTFVVLQGTDLVAIVRDGGEEHFSLPGGTCELRETDAA